MWEWWARLKEATERCSRLSYRVHRTFIAMTCQARKEHIQIEKESFYISLTLKLNWQDNGWQYFCADTCSAFQFQRPTEQTWRKDNTSLLPRNFDWGSKYSDMESMASNTPQRAIHAPSQQANCCSFTLWCHYMETHLFQSTISHLICPVKCPHLHNEA